MNHKELIRELSKRLNMDSEQIENVLQITCKQITDQLIENNQISIQGFGLFDTKRSNPRVVVNPLTKQRTITPSKQVVVFKPSALVKEKLKELKK